MLKENDVAPDFVLPMFQREPRSFYSCITTGVVLVFYKFSCPTCQLAFPFLQKIYNAYGDVFPFLAIAQDDEEKTADFRKNFGITIPTALDLPPYAVSRQYDIRTVPTIFLIDNDHKIQFAGEGFSRQEMLNLANVLARKTGRPQIDVFGEAKVPEFKPG